MAEAVNRYLTQAGAVLFAHRSAVAAADGATKPAANNAAWLTNPGGARYADVFVSTTGSPTTCTLRPYTRVGGTAGAVGQLDAVTLNGTPNFDAGFTLDLAGLDLLIYVETLSGGSSPTVTVQVSWWR